MAVYKWNFAAERSEQFKRALLPAKVPVTHRDETLGYSTIPHDGIVVLDLSEDLIFRIRTTSSIINAIGTIFPGGEHITEIQIFDVD